MYHLTIRTQCIYNRYPHTYQLTIRTQYIYNRCSNMYQLTISHSTYKIGVQTCTT